MSITTPHSLGMEEATERLKKFFEKLKARHQDNQHQRGADRRPE
ncbi:MAG: polyhydroxyalkanoic acid system family protein [Planctomycetia bacterium]|nr:polyhydroxyalkanoic acid system family protein [Planctomycetia bacterium]